jgi:hypothetical protein
MINLNEWFKTTNDLKISLKQRLKWITYEW